jgi:N-acetylglucosaminyldiphosphoundecaprenol N-acetyl-beta-D-mannosaminyltransferase
MTETLNILDQFIKERIPRLIITADASGLVMATDDPAWRDLLNRADLVTPDSTGVVWALRRKGAHLADRVSGCDIADELCRRSVESGYRIYLLGGGPGIAVRASRHLEAKYPGCHIVGTDNGFFDETGEPEILNRIRAAEPDVLLVAMGMPKQEQWIARNMRNLRVPVSMGVGGTLDVFAGVARRAPRFVQKLRMEWAWRLALNPRKFKKVAALPIFVMKVLREPSSTKGV